MKTQHKLLFTIFVFIILIGMVSATMAAPGPLSLVGGILKEGKVGTPYSMTLRATGGAEPYSYSDYRNTLPSGLSINAITGEISGEPTVTGSYGRIYIRVTDNEGKSITATFSMNIIIDKIDFNVTNTNYTYEEGVPRKATVVPSKPGYVEGEDYFVTYGNLPTQTDAGIYFIKVTLAENVKAMVGNLNQYYLSIGRDSNSSISIDGEKNRVYYVGEGAINFTATVSPAGLPYYFEYEGQYGTNYPKSQIVPSEVGKYNVTAVLNNSNYVERRDMGTLNIYKHVDISISGTSVYNKEVTTPAINISEPDWIFGKDYYLEYVIGDKNFYSMVDVGIYEPKIRISSDRIAQGYVSRDVSGSYEITKKVVTIGGLTGINRPYDGSIRVYLSGGHINGNLDDNNLTALYPSSGLVEDENTGNDKIVAINNITLSGSAVGNYQLDEQPVVTVNILPIIINPKIIVTPKVYNGNDIANVNIDFTGITFIKSDRVTATANGTFDQVDVADDLDVTLSDVNIKGNTNNNYDVVIPNIVKGDIIKAAAFSVETPASIDSLAATANIHTFNLSGIVISPTNVGAKTYRVESLEDANSVIQSTKIEGNNLIINTNNTARVGDIVKVKIAIATNNYETAYTFVRLNIVINSIDFNIITSEYHYDGTVKSVTVESNPKLTMGKEFKVDYRLNGVNPVVEPIGAGEYFIAINFIESGKYRVGKITGNTTIKIQKRPVTIKDLIAPSRAYNGSNLVALSGGVLDSKIEGDDLGFTMPLDATMADKNIGQNKSLSFKPITLTGARASSYDLTAQPIVIANITPKKIQPIVNIIPKKYDGNKNANTVVDFTGLIETGDNVTATVVGTYENASVGKNKIVYIGALNNVIGNELGNYNVLEPVQPYGDINKKDAIAIAKPASLTIKPGIVASYDFNTKDLNIKAMDMGNKTYTAEIVADSNHILDGIPSISDDMVTIKVLGSVKALDTASIKINVHSDNYEDSSAIIDLVTSKVEVNFTISNNTTMYNAEPQEVTVISSIPSLISGSDYKIIYKQNGTEADHINAGNYDISIEMMGAADSTYKIAGITGSKLFTINKKPVSVTGIVATSRDYDGTQTVNITGGIISGKIDGDNVDCTVPATGNVAEKKQGKAKAVSYAPITLAGAAAGNYVLSDANPKLYVDINPKSIKPIANVTSKTFNNNRIANISIDFTGLLADGDILNATANGTFDNDANVGMAKPVTLSNFTVISGNTDGNYLVATPAKPNGDITKSSTGTATKPVNMSIPTIANRKHTFDLSSIKLNAINAGTLSYSATEGNDGNNIISDVAVVENKLEITTGDTVTAGNTASVNITITSTNYENISTTLDIEVATKDINVDFAISNNTVAYSGEVQVPTIVTTPMVDPSDYTVEYMQNSLKVDAGAVAVGTYTMSFKFTEGNGYKLRNIANNSFEIKKKDVTIDGLVATNRAYDGTNVVNIDRTGASINGKIKDEDVDFTVADTGTILEAGHGAGKAVSFANIVLTGTDMGNYNLVSQPKLTVNITPKTVMPTAVITPKFYNGDRLAEVSLSFAEGDIVLSDSVAVTATGEFATAGAGEGIAVTLENIVITGNEAGNYTVNMPGNVTSDISKATLLNAPQVKGLTVDSGTAQKYTYDLDTIDFGVADMGDKTYVINEVEDTANILESATVDADGKTAIINVKTTASPGNTAKIKVVVTSQNYNNYEVFINVYVDVDEVDFTITNSETEYSGAKMYPTITTSPAIGVGDYTVEYKLDGVEVAVEPKEADIYHITITMNNSLYTVGAITGGNTFTINKKPVTITGLTATDRQYDGSMAVNLTGGTIEGKIGEDDITAIMPTAGTLGDKNYGDSKPVSFAPITLEGAAAGNYALTQPTITVNIAPKDIIPGVTIDIKPYDTTTNAKANFDFAGLIETGDTNIAATTTANFANAEIGSDKVVTLENTSTVSGNEAENYNITYPTEAIGNIGKALATIAKPAPVTVVAGSSLTFDISELAFNSLATGDITYKAEIINNESGIIATCELDGSVISYTISESVADKQSASIKITASTPNTEEAVTYLNLNTGVVGIDFIISDNTAIYSGEEQGVTISTVPDNMLDKWDVIYTLVGDDTKTEVSPIKVGIYNVEIAIKAPEGGYIVNSIAGDKTFTITKKPVTISGKIAIDREYNGENSVVLSNSAAVIDGKFESDTVTADIPASGTVTSVNQGTDKVVTFNDITLGGDKANNYELTEQPTITVNINPKIISPIYAVTGRVYDGTKNINVTTSFAEGAILNNEITVKATGELESPDAGEQTVNVTHEVTGNENGNYEIVTVTSPTVTIKKASGLTVEKLANLGVSPNIAKTYDYDLSALKFNKADMGDKSYNVSIVAGGSDILDTISLEADTLKIPVKGGAVKGNTATIAITINSKNYESCKVNLKIEVKDIAVNFAISENTKIYSGEAQGVTIVTSPAISANDYTISYKLNGAGEDVVPTDVGIYTVQIALKPESGYVLGIVEDKMLTIEKKTVKPTATAEEKKYNGTLNAKVSLIFDEGDIATNDNGKLIVEADAYFATADVGSDKDISIGTIRTSGVAATNYNVVQADNIKGNIEKAEAMTNMDNVRKVSRRSVDTIEIDADTIELAKDDTGIKSYTLGAKTDVDNIIESFALGEDGKTITIITNATSQAGQSATIPVTVTMGNYEDSIVHIIVKVENAVVNFTFDQTRYLTNGINAVKPIISNTEIPELEAYTVSYKNQTDSSTELIKAGIYDVTITITDPAYTLGTYPKTIELVAKKNISPTPRTINIYYTGEKTTWTETFSFNDADLTEGKDIVVTATASFKDENIGNDKSIVFTDLVITGANSEYYDVQAPTDWVGSISYENIKLIGANVPTAKMNDTQRETFKTDRMHNGNKYSVEAWGNGMDYDMLSATIIVYEGKDFDFTAKSTAESTYDIAMTCKDSNEEEISTTEELTRGVYTLEYQTSIPGSTIIKRYLVVLGKLGDVNEDGVVNSIDANYLESGVWPGGGTTYPSGYGYRTFDVNGDGDIDKADATAIYRINKEPLKKIYQIIK